MEIPKFAHIGKYSALILEETCGKFHKKEKIVIVAGQGNDQQVIAEIFPSNDIRADRDNAQLIINAVSKYLNHS